MNQAGLVIFINCAFGIVANFCPKSQTFSPILFYKLYSFEFLYLGLNHFKFIWHEVGIKVHFVHVNCQMCQDHVLGNTIPSQVNCLCTLSKNKCLHIHGFIWPLSIPRVSTFLHKAQVFQALWASSLLELPIYYCSTRVAIDNKHGGAVFSNNTSWTWSGLEFAKSCSISLIHLFIFCT